MKLAGLCFTYTGKWSVWLWVRVYTAWESGGKERKVLNAETFGLHVCMERTISDILRCPSIYREGGRRRDVGSKRKNDVIRQATK